MSYYVRLMRKEDIPQVTRIDREAFSNQWPPPDYRHELQNRVAHYIVACNEDKKAEQPEVKAPPEEEFTGLAARLRWLISRRFFSNEPPPPSREYITGFTGLWVVADEAHITNIAVREARRRQGIGELLLISLIDLAVELKANIVTLEVRTSNTVAQSLYTKYGFNQVGKRRGYYVDNREDGILMSTPDISSVAFQTHLQQLKQAHSRKLCVSLYQIAR